MTAAFYVVLLALSATATISKTEANVPLYRPLEAELLDQLVKNCSLQEQVLPSVNSETLDVTIRFELYRFVALSDKEEKLEVLADVQLSWRHPCVKWDTGNDSRWANISELSIDPSRIWRPVIQHLNAVDDVFALTKMGLETPATLFPDGTILAEPMGRFDSTCELQLRKFPFDSQKCEIRLESWKGVKSVNFTSAKMVLFERYNIVDNEGIWRIMNADSTLIQAIYNADPMPYSRAIFTIYLQRNYVYYLGSTLLPVGALSFLLLATFMMPPEYSDRPYFASSVVLAIAVLMLFVSGIMPVTSQLVLLSVNMACQFVIGTLITAYTLLTCSIARHKFFSRPRIYFCRQNGKWRSSLSLIRLLDISVALLATIATVCINAITYLTISS